MKDSYVSRAGVKLKFGLDYFNVSVKDLVCADFGCSKGGFTDCLLQEGAQKVYSIDTSYGEFDYALRSNSKVVLLERTNGMYVKLPELMDFISVDVSWTRQEKILENVLANLKASGKVIALIKPSFEAPPAIRFKLTQDETLYAPIVEDVIKKLVELYPVTVSAPVESPILGDKGKNKEYLVFITKT